MPAQKDDPLTATHYRCDHHTAVGHKGSLVTAEKVKESLGRVPNSSDADHAKHLEAGLTRLLDLGAISPAEAPPEPEEQEMEAKKAEAAAEKKAAEERKAADEEEAAKKHPPHKR